MCLNIKYPAKKVKELPKEFTAYKVVRKIGCTYYYPLFQIDKAIEKNNRLCTMNYFDVVRSGGLYKPYYHSFRSVAACREVMREQGHKYSFIKIRIKRKDVTCVGAMGATHKPGYQVIVSRAFSTEFEEVKL